MRYSSSQCMHDTQQLRSIDAMGCSQSVCVGAGRGAGGGARGACGGARVCERHVGFPENSHKRDRDEMESGSMIKPVNIGQKAGYKIFR
jgi:hypothetical protein